MRPLIIALGALLPSVIACTAQPTNDTGSSTSALTAPDDAVDSSIEAVKARGHVGRPMTGAPDTTPDNSDLDASIETIKARGHLGRPFVSATNADQAQDTVDASLEAIKARGHIGRGMPQ